MSLRLALGAMLIVMAAGLGWLAVGINLERACTLSQWPELPSCSRPSDNALVQAQLLRERIARNPGDSDSWIELAMLTSQPDKVPRMSHDSVLGTATRLAGEDYRVKRMLAARAIEQQQWPQAVDWLVRLVQGNHDAMGNRDPQAALVLAMLLREPQALEAMQALLKPGSTWLEPVIYAMPQARIPVVMAMPLVVHALAQQGLSVALTQRLLHELKASGQWLEAHALWTAWLGKPVALVFNGDFEQGFMAEGFDWQVTPAPPAKAGALVRQVTSSGHGGVLQVDFTGKPVALPVVRQHLVLLNHRFVLDGQYMATRLRVNDGLAWVLLCVADGREVARTPALKDTAGQWRAFTVEFELPAGCGMGVALQLQTFAPYEAVTGLSGQAMFDNFKLEVRE